MLSTGTVEFDDNRSDYRHCCCHARIASIIIASICIVQSILLLLTVVITFSKGGSMLGLAVFIVILILSIACIAVMSLLINGIERQRVKLVSPAMVFLVIAELGLIAAVVFIIYTMTTVENGSDRKFSLLVLGGLLFLCFVSMLITVYYIFVFRKAYNYLRDKEMSLKLIQSQPLEYPYVRRN